MKTSLPSAQVRDQLVQHFDANDKLAVFLLQESWATQGLDKDCDEWLRNNM